MALTASLTITPEVPGSRKEVYGTITFDSSYATGGESLSLADIGFTRLDYLQVSSNSGHFPTWDGSVTAPKILMFYTGAAVSTAFAEVASATNLSTVSIRFRAVGA